MYQCKQCQSVFKRALQREYSFLAMQLDQCETCVAADDKTLQIKQTYDAVRLNYVVAYWEWRRQLL